MAVETLLELLKGPLLPGKRKLRCAWVLHGCSFLLTLFELLKDPLLPGKRKLRCVDWGRFGFMVVLVVLVGGDAFKAVKRPLLPGKKS